MFRILAIAALGYAVGWSDAAPRGTRLASALAGFHEAVNAALVEGPRPPNLAPLRDLGIALEIERAVARLPLMVALREMGGR